MKCEVCGDIGEVRIDEENTRDCVCKKLKTNDEQNEEEKTY